jgi:hypothetical protein
MVIDMDADKLTAAFAEAKARSRLLLDPAAYRTVKVKQAEQCCGDVVVQRQAPPVVVERRTYDGVGWSPPPLMAAEFVEILPPKPKSKPLSETEIEALVESRVERALRKHLVVTPKAIAPILIELRQQLRAEIAKSHMPNRPAGEFFYLDDDGNKQDAELHNPILRAVDYPIDEKIMGPIRARHRAKWLAGQKAKRAARIIDLPALPLRSSRRA